MMKSLSVILELQELDMNMIRLMNLKKKRQDELDNIHSLRKDLEEQLTRKEHDVMELKKDVKLTEVRVREIEEKIEKLEKQQSAVKKVDEFNALNLEMTHASREKQNLGNQISEQTEQLVREEEILTSIQESLSATNESSRALEKEIHDGIVMINSEGRELKLKRDEVAKRADEEVLRVYQRLLNNKKDRVLVPVENRACSGCHIVVTAQHENLVRKGERLVFCEHCSRLHYWPGQELEAGEGEEGASATRRRRRRGTAASA